MRPPFIRVLPAEVERYGPHAAIVLAHIRFRCESDGPGRVTADGVRWWRVPLVDMAGEMGLSVRGVRTALTALGDAVAAKHFKPLSNQSRAYRVTTHQNGADLPVVETDNWNDQPECEIDNSHVEIDSCTSQNRHLHMSKSTSVLPIKELKKGEKAALTQVRIDQPHNGSRQLTTHKEISIEPPKRACTRYPHSDACGTCGADKRAYQTWLADSRRLLADLDRERDAPGCPEQRATEISNKRRSRIAVFQRIGEPWK